MIVSIRALKTTFVELPLNQGGIKMKEDIQITVNEREKKLLELIRETKYGELKIIVQDSLPIRVQEIRESFEL